jgi:hypothetical protein
MKKARADLTLAGRTNCQFVLQVMPIGGDEGEAVFG